jgi:hypothetical protein
MDPITITLIGGGTLLLVAGTVGYCLGRSSQAKKDKIIIDKWKKAYNEEAARHKMTIDRCDKLLAKLSEREVGRFANLQ